MPPRRNNQEDVAFEPLEPLKVELDGNNGLSEENIRTGMKPTDLRFLMLQVNEVVADRKQGKLKPFHAPPMILEHFNRDGYLVIATLSRWIQTDKGLITSNPVTGLCVATIVQDDEKTYAYIEKAVYNLVGQDVIHANHGTHPFQVDRVLPFDPSRLAPAYVIKTACDLAENNDMDKFKALFDQVIRVLELFVKNQTTRRVWGFFATSSKIHRCTLVFPFMLFNFKSSGFSDVGLLPMIKQGLLSLEEANVINTTGASLIDDFTSVKEIVDASEPKRTRKRRAQQDAQEGEEESGEEEYNPYANKDIFPYHDGTEAYPTPEAVYKKSLPQRDADSKQSLVKMDLSFCPFNKLLKELPETVRDNMKSETTERLFEVAARIFFNADDVVRVSGMPATNEEDVIWRIDGCQPFVDTQKLGLLKLKAAFQGIVTLHAKRSLFFSRLLHIGGATMLADVVDKLVQSREITWLLMEKLDLHNDDLFEIILEKRRFYPLFFSLLHTFVTDFISEANVMNKMLLEAKLFKIQGQPEFPKKDVLFKTTDNSEKAARDCAGVARVFSRDLLMHRVPMKRSIIEENSCFFTVGVVHDDLNGLVVRAERLRFGNLLQVFSSDPALPHLTQFRTYVSTQQDTVLLNIVGYTEKALEFIASSDEATTASEIPAAKMVRIVMAETCFSVWMNFIKNRSYLEYVFDWGKEAGLDKVLEAILDPPLPEDKLDGESLTTKLKQIGDTDYLREKLDWIKTSELRALVLASLMPVREINEDNTAIKPIRISICTLTGQTLEKNARSLEFAGDDMSPLPEDYTYTFDEYVKHDIFAEPAPQD
jgi:hypothetical protein